MPKFYVRRYFDAYIRYEKAFEAPDAETARQLAKDDPNGGGDPPDGWGIIEPCEFDDCQYEVLDENGEEVIELDY